MSLFFSMVIFLTLLLFPTKSFAQSANTNEQLIPSLKDDPLNNEKNKLVAPEELTRVETPQLKESPLSLKKVDDTTIFDSK